MGTHTHTHTHAYTLTRARAPNAETRDRTGDLLIFSLTLSQLSYRGLILSEHLSIECYNTCNTTIEAFWTYFLCFWARCRARIFPILVPSGARSHQGANGHSASFQACPL